MFTNLREQRQNGDKMKLNSISILFFSNIDTIMDAMYCYKIIYYHEC